jgi:hypothetical protein
MVVVLVTFLPILGAFYLPRKRVSRAGDWVAGAKAVSRLLRKLHPSCSEA